MRRCCAERTGSRTARAYLDAVDAAGRRGELISYATKCIRQYNNAGIWDSNTARVRAWRLLNSEAGQATLDRLARRFCEFLVDETQDCDAPEMNIFRRLAIASHLILVADPDQAIFEFRGGHPDLFCAYRDEQEHCARVILDVNYRSTATICAAVSSLRVAGQKAVVSADPTVGLPILIFAGTPRNSASSSSKHSRQRRSHRLTLQFWATVLAPSEQCSGAPRTRSPRRAVTASQQPARC